MTRLGIETQTELQLDVASVDKTSLLDSQFLSKDMKREKEDARLEKQDQETHTSREEYRQNYSQMKR